MAAVFLGPSRLAVEGSCADSCVAGAIREGGRGCRRERARIPDAVAPPLPLSPASPAHAHPTATHALPARVPTNCSRRLRGMRRHGRRVG